MGLQVGSALLGWGFAKNLGCKHVCNLTRLTINFEVLRLPLACFVILWCEMLGEAIFGFVFTTFGAQVKEQFAIGCDLRIRCQCALGQCISGHFLCLCKLGPVPSEAFS